MKLYRASCDMVGWILMMNTLPLLRQRLGRELFTPDEVRKLDNKKCIIFIRGFDPIMDNKFIPFNHPMFNQTADGKPKWEDTITNRMLHWSYTPEQKEEVKKALAAGVPKATILTYFYPEVTVEKMSAYRQKQ